MITFARFKRGCLYLLIILSVVSCVTSPPVPPEEYYARNYGEVVRPGAEADTEARPGDGNRAAAGEGNEPAPEGADSQFEVEQVEDGKDKTPGDDVYGGDNTADQGPVPDDNTRTAVPVEGDDLKELLAAEGVGQAAEKTPLNSPAVKSESAGEAELEFKTLEEKMYYVIGKSYNERDPQIFYDTAAKFIRLFPKSAYMPDVDSYLNTFYLRESLLTAPYKNAIFNLERLRDSDYAYLDRYFARIKEMGFGYILWKPFVNNADYHTNPPPAKGDVGALFASNMIQVYADRLPAVVDAARKADLKILFAFPMRDHPWVRYGQKRLPEDTWFAGASAYGMSPMLNLLHPEIYNYFKPLLRELVQYGPDGIVFENDFTHHIFEGFHELNLLVYEDKVYEDSLTRNAERYNRNVQPRQYFNGSITGKYDNDYATNGQLNSNTYQDYYTWRINRIGALMTRLIGDLRVMHESMMIGKAMKHLGTAPEFIYGLPTDIIIMDKALYGSYKPFNYAEYKKGADTLSRSMPKDRQLFLSAMPDKTIPLSYVNRNTEQIEALRHSIQAKGLVASGILDIIRREITKADMKKNGDTLAQK
ncbi:hypothetical protein CHS0354_018355 [Potamilus streckersoni]|uniref:Uncharacterized protein n=1 Tax=Potamilus streckersoni TaxID=2493646 RepID=A0AAE0TAR3_9BIVA|nr:hypothetical protein CHS0354_018355 [Potamilus streckersoni]